MLDTRPSRRGQNRLCAGRTRALKIRVQATLQRARLRGVRPAETRRSPEAPPRPGAWPRLPLCCGRGRHLALRAHQWITKITTARHRDGRARGPDRRAPWQLLPHRLGATGSTLLAANTAAVLPLVQSQPAAARLLAAPEPLHRRTSGGGSATATVPAVGAWHARGFSPDLRRGRLQTPRQEEGSFAAAAGSSADHAQRQMADMFSPAADGTPARYPSWTSTCALAAQATNCCHLASATAAEARHDGRASQNWPRRRLRLSRSTAGPAARSSCECPLVLIFTLSLLRFACLPPVQRSAGVFSAYTPQPALGSRKANIRRSRGGPRGRRSLPAAPRASGG